MSFLRVHPPAKSSWECAVWSLRCSNSDELRGVPHSHLCCMLSRVEELCFTTETEGWCSQARAC